MLHRITGKKETEPVLTRITCLIINIQRPSDVDDYTTWFPWNGGLTVNGNVSFRFSEKAHYLYLDNHASTFCDVIETPFTRFSLFLKIRSRFICVSCFTIIHQNKLLHLFIYFYRSICNSFSIHEKSIGFNNQK